MSVVKPASPAAASRLPCPPEGIDEFVSRPSHEAAAVLTRTSGPVLILGAGGKLGLHLSVMAHRALAAVGRRDAVVAVSRFKTLHDRAAFDRHGISTLAADLSDPASLAALPDAPTIFFLAGVKFGTAAAPELLQRLNVEMPRLVAQRFYKSRIVAFSSGCVYPFVRADSGGATEQTPPAPVGDYAASCLARELAFAEVSRAQGTRVALIRLNYSVEFRYGLLVDIAQKVFTGQPVDVTTGHVNVIFQRDALDHTIRCLELAASPAAPINITGAETLSVRAVAHRLGEIMGRPVTIVGQEADTAWLNNASYSHRHFGRPPTRVDDMLIWISEWLRLGGASWGKPTGFEQRDGQF